MQSSDHVLQRATSLKAAGSPFVLATVVRAESPTSAKPGAKAIVDADGGIDGWIGGGCAQPAVIKTAKQALQDGQPRLIRVSPKSDQIVESGVVDFGMTCHSGGTLDIFLEPIAGRPQLLIIGHSPAAQALSALASRCGFDVDAMFPGATAEQFPDAREVIDGFKADERGRANPAFIVVATQGKHDEQGLETALAIGSRSIGFIASERKAAKLKDELKARGHDAQQLEAIVSPAGIEIGAQTPEEIALSVLAGLVRERRLGTPMPAEARVANRRPAPAAPTDTGPSCCAGSAEPRTVEASA
jgi:xanthine dehydrogenase accessory factor